jgi:riboflavin synthase
MFTGIIETLGTIQEIKRKGNVHITVDSSITTELKIDQSVAHNGICLTVVELKTPHIRLTKQLKNEFGNWKLATVES